MGIEFQFQLTDETLWTLLGGIHDQVSDFPIEGVAGFKQFLQACFGIFRFQEGTMAIMAGAMPELVHAAAQINHDPLLAQTLTGQGT